MQKFREERQKQQDKEDAAFRKKGVPLNLEVELVVREKSENIKINGTSWENTLLKEVY